MKIMQLVIILNGINYNSFKTNVLIMTPALLVPYILILHKTAKINETEEYFAPRAVGIVMILIFI